MRPAFSRDGIEMYLGDCRDVLPGIPKCDAIVTDVPYGIGEAAGKNKSRGKLAVSKDYGNLSWDDKPISQELLQLCMDHAKWQVVFGANYYTMPPTSCWLVWWKMNGGTDFADCELAWTNLKKAVRMISYQWHGFIRDGVDVRVHPTQKPADVMQWCISHLPSECETILDPFGGSFTTAIACIRAGKKFIGIERERDYFDAGVARIEREFARTSLFDAPKPRQKDFLG